MLGMNGWRFDITDSGKQDLAKLDTAIQRHVLEKLKWFTENFQNITPFPLGNIWRGFFKLRVGDWRIVYDADHETKSITVHAIDNRDKVYKRT